MMMRLVILLGIITTIVLATSNEELINEDPKWTSHLTRLMGHQEIPTLERHTPSWARLWLTKLCEPESSFASIARVLSILKEKGQEECSSLCSQIIEMLREKSDADIMALLKASGADTTEAHLLKVNQSI